MKNKFHVILNAYNVNEYEFWEEKFIFVLMLSIKIILVVWYKIEQKPYLSNWTVFDCTGLLCVCVFTNVLWNNTDTTQLDIFTFFIKLVLYRVIKTFKILSILP